MAESGYTYDVGVLLRGMGVYPLKLSLPYTAGVADSWYDGPAGDLWVEWKHYRDLPATIDLLAGKKPKLSKLQQEWLKDRYDNGRNVAVIVGSPRGGVILQRLAWTFPISRERFLETALPKAGLADWIYNQTMRPRREQ